MFKILDLRSGDYRKDWTGKYDLSYRAEQEAKDQIVSMVIKHNLYESVFRSHCIESFFDVVEVPDV